MGEIVPVVEYYLAGRDGRLAPGDDLWNVPLYGEDSHPSVKASPFSVGEYLSAAGAFLQKNNYAFIEKGLAFLGKGAFVQPAFKKIFISLEKHGPFYHPLKVTVISDKKENTPFVLNGAVSDEGLSIIEKEYRCLSAFNQKTSELKDQYTEGFVPEVFGIDFIESDKGRIGFFLAQWFEDFEEFHVVVSPGNAQRIGILNKNGSFSCVSESESFEIFKKASEILTFYYDIPSCSQIFPWHHAAGDFVVRINKNKTVDVKLITVRGYGPLMEADSENPLLGVFFFFLNLTLRMRLDRNRGIMEYVFLDEFVVKSSIKGFIKGLKTNLAVNIKSKNIPDDFLGVFIDLIKGLDLEKYRNAFSMIAESYGHGSPEAAFVHQNIEKHAESVFRAVKDI